MRVICRRRGIRGGLQQRFEGYSLPERKVRRGMAALLSGFAAVEVKKKGGRSVLRALCRRGGHSIENQTVKITLSYRFEVGEGSLISLIIKTLDSTATWRKACLRLEEEGGGSSGTTATRPLGYSATRLLDYSAEGVKRRAARSSGVAPRK